MTEEVGQGRHRYPGVQPFEDAPVARKLFRGRDKEAYELLQLVLAEPLVLLFSRSGMGKSSLVNAGILAPLRQRNFLPMVVRVTGANADPLANVYDGIRSATDSAEAAGEVEIEPPAAEWNKTSLWHFFKTIELWRGSTLLSPVLIVDQFEELFTLTGAEGRERFIHELADLVRGRRPRDVKDPEDSMLSDKPPEIRVILVLREEFYANLQEMRERIPQIYKAPYRLEPLSRKAARAAIAEPAAFAGEEFDCPPFAWEDDALNMVLDFLSEQRSIDDQQQKSGEIEPFQLQLICRHVEDMVRERGLSSVSRESLGGPQELKRILSDFYEDTLNRICKRFPKNPKLREQLQLLCENGLVSASGRRLLREESEIAKNTGVGSDVLRRMVELRLLRKEPRVGDNYYELTHDTLIEPIRLSRQLRQDRERAQKRRRNNLIAGTIATAFIGLTAILVYGNYTSSQLAATKSEEVAELEFEKQRAIEAIEKRAVEEIKKVDAERQKVEEEKDEVSRKAEETERKLLATQEELAENEEQQKLSKAETKALKIASALALIEAEVEAARRAVLEAEQAVQKHLVRLDEARAEVATAEALAKDAVEGKFQAGDDASKSPQQQAEELLARAKDNLETELETYDALRETVRVARTDLAVAQDKLDAPDEEIAKLVQTVVRTAAPAPDDAGSGPTDTEGMVEVVVMDAPEEATPVSDAAPAPEPKDATAPEQKTLAAVAVTEPERPEAAEAAKTPSASGEDVSPDPAGAVSASQDAKAPFKGYGPVVIDERAGPRFSEDDEERTRRRDARLALAELSSLENDIDMTDRELSRRYGIFLSTNRTAISSENRVFVAKRLIALSNSADTFESLQQGRLASREEPEGLSLCEAYDQWTTYTPAREVGPEADAKKRITALLKRKTEETLTVSTQANFITVSQRNNLVLDTEFKLRRPVYVYVWANSNTVATPILEYRYEGGQEFVWHPNQTDGAKRVRVQPNPLRGERSGYRLWTRKNARAPGLNSFLLWNVDGDLVCRRDFNVSE